MRRRLYLAAGIVSAALGAIGAVLPVLPTVPFLILAAFCFARSNPAWERRLLDHPRWGAAIRNWRERGAIARRAKWSASAALMASAALAFATMSFPWVLAALTPMAIAAGWIWTRRE